MQQAHRSCHLPAANIKMKIEPPKFANRFLEWYCAPALLDEIQGDVFELYYREARVSKRKAYWLFVWNVIRFFRWRNIRKRKSYQSNNLTMLSSYLKIGFRNVIRNGATSFINMFGLSIGVASVITMFIFADQFFHTDDFHIKADRIYEITNVVNRDSKSVTLSNVPTLLITSLEQEIPGIERTVQFQNAHGFVRHNDLVFSQYLYFVDDSFFDVFNFPFLEGNASALNNRNNIVLNKRMAEKYFGTVPALGQTLSIKFRNETKEDFTVTAVVDQPANNTMYFDFLIPMEVYEDLYPASPDSWSAMSQAAFVLMKQGHSFDEVLPHLGNYIKLQNQSSPEWMTEKFTSYPLPSLSTRSWEIEDGVMGSGNPQGVVALLVIGFMLLLLACFNYMNIAVATITTRLKEIGIRKVIGGNRKEIVQQFLTENLVLCLFATGMGLFISYFFFMPWLNNLVAYAIPFEFSSGISMTLFFSALLLFVVVISGVYPALYISGFQPIAVLKGREKFGQRSKFSRVLLTAQFVLAFTTIVGCFVFIDNSFYLKSKDWGYNHEQKISVPVANAQQYQQLRDAVSTNKSIISYAGSLNHIGRSYDYKSIETKGTRTEIVHIKVGFDYLSTMDINLKRGRFFDERIQSDRVESVIVNENFVKAMGWEDGLNQAFEFDSVKRVVIGVVNNFHYRNFYHPILPVMFSIAPEGEFRYLSMKVAAGSINQTDEWLRNSWKKIAPDDPYEGKMQDDVFLDWSRNNETEMSLMIFIAGMALVLASLGLFGLVSYNITRRLKEFSVRKVFGASVTHIFRLMNRDYIWILSIAFIIGAPAGFFLMDFLVNLIYVDPQPAGIIPFALAILIMIITVAVTVGVQMNRVVKENPAHTLRNE